MAPEGLLKPIKPPFVVTVKRAVFVRKDQKLVLMPAEKTSVNESAIPWPAKPSTIVTSKTDRKSLFARPPVLSVARVRENWFWVSPGMAQYCPEPALMSREDFCPCLPLSGGLGRKRVSHNFSKRRPGGLRLTALRHSSGRGRPRDRHAGRGGLPQEINLRRGQGVGLVDEVAEGALQGHSFGDEGAGGLDGAGVFVAQRLCLLLPFPGHSTRSQSPGGLPADAKRIQHRLGSGRAGVLAWCA